MQTVPQLTCPLRTTHSTNILDNTPLGIALIVSSSLTSPRGVKWLKTQIWIIINVHVYRIWVSMSGIYMCPCKPCLQSCSLQYEHVQTGRAHAVKSYVTSSCPLAPGTSLAAWQASDTNQTKHPHLMH